MSPETTTSQTYSHTAALLYEYKKLFTTIEKNPLLTYVENWMHFEQNERKGEDGAKNMTQKKYLALSELQTQYTENTMIWKSKDCN